MDINNPLRLLLVIHIIQTNPAHTGNNQGPPYPQTALIIVLFTHRAPPAFPASSETKKNSFSTTLYHTSWCLLAVFNRVIARARDA